MNISILVKTCTGCKIVKTATNDYFAKDKSGRYGLRARCKECDKAYRKKHYQENRESIREKQNEYLKRYYVENKDDILEYKRGYYQENREDILYKYREYRLSNKEKINEYKRNYKRNNRHLFNQYRQKRRALKRSLPNSFTVDQWETAKSHFYNLCAYCGRDKELQQDHFIPLSAGGEYTVNNIIPSCVSCNSSKGNRSFFDWYHGYKYYSEERSRKVLDYLNYNNKEIGN